MIVHDNHTTVEVLMSRSLGRPCSVCASLHVDKIDAQPRRKLRLVASEFGVSVPALARHRRPDHVRRAPRPAPAEEERCELTRLLLSEDVRLFVQLVSYDLARLGKVR